MSLSHRALATPCGGSSACTLTSVASCRVFPLTHWCFFGQVCSVSRSNTAWRRRVSEDAWLSTFAYPKSVQELHRWDKTVTTNWGEKGVKIEVFARYCRTYRIVPRSVWWWDGCVWPGRRTPLGISLPSSSPCCPASSCSGQLRCRQWPYYSAPAVSAFPTCHLRKWK